MKHAKINIFPGKCTESGISVSTENHAIQKVCQEDGPNVCKNTECMAKNGQCTL